MMVEVVLQPVVRGAFRVLRERFLVARAGAIELGAFEQHFLQTVDTRAMRVAFFFAERVVLTVNGNPFASRRTRVQPEPEAANVANDRMEVHGAMRLVPMVVQRN